MNDALAELKKENEDLRKALDDSRLSLQSFVYAVSHDLSAPLRALTSFSEIVKKRYGTALDDRGRSYLDFIQDGGQRAQEMMAGLLRFSRVYSQGGPPEECSLEKIVQKTLDKYADKLDACGTHLSVNPLPVILGDPLQLEQLIGILIDNALTYKHPRLPLELQITATQTDTHWQISVEDNGIGVPVECRERIFQIFKRLHTDEEFPGLGVGLAVAARITERHGGDMLVQSSPSGGSIFSFTLSKDGPNAPFLK
ncbi:MAG: ATP-binding protein [Bdellovibrionales bacterium]